jgi:peptidoglycan/xylan/chitin deacetylase (PgdA/CDA1 family)
MPHRMMNPNSKQTSSESSAKLRLAFLLAQDIPRERQTIAALCKLEYVKPVAVFLIPTRAAATSVEQAERRSHTRARSGYFGRLAEKARCATGRALTSSVVSQAEVQNVLRRAFGERFESLQELAARYEFPLYPVDDLWGPDTLAKMGLADIDLGVSLQRLSLPRQALSFMRLGCIYSQKGNRGFASMPAGFWELCDGATSAEADVSFIGESPEQDHVITRGSVPVAQTETPDTLQEKLESEGERLLLQALHRIRDGKLSEQPFAAPPVVARPKATKQDLAALRERLPHWTVKSMRYVLVRNLYTLAVYYSGVYLGVRLWHRLTGRSRAAILLYHRVNTYSKDVLTVDPETFAAQLLAISARYRITSTIHLVDCIQQGRPLTPTTIAIHFDDTYQDIVTNGAPILRALGLPACAFLNSGYIDTTREYPHDIQDSPFRFNNLKSSDVLEWTSSGCEVGAHTANHIDLGGCPADVAYEEARLCGSALERLLHQPIKLFAFPYGRPEHMSAENRQALERADFHAIFSCDGGFINGQTKATDIPRMECFYEYAPLHCLLQIEGLTLHQLARRANHVWRTLRQLSRASSLKKQPNVPRAHAATHSVPHKLL